MALAYLKLPLQLLPGGNKENCPFFIKCSIITEMLQQGLYFKCSSKDFVTVKCCDLMSIKDCVLRPLTWFLSFNRTQSRAVTGLLTGHNTLRRHLHLLGLSDSPLCRRCRAQDKTLAHILCECEALASLRHMYLGSFF
jgi:hypothetical protein